MGSRYDGHQPVDGRSTEEDVLGGIGIDDQIPNPYGLGILLLAESGIELNVALGTHPLTREPDNMVVVRHHFELGYPHGFERFPIEDVYRTPLVHKGLLDGESVYIDRYHHGVILAVIHALEVFICEGDGWHPRSECHHIHLMHRSQVFLSDVVGAPSSGEVAGYGVDNLSVTSSIGLPGRVVPAGRVVSPRPAVVPAVSIVSASWR